MSSNRPLAFVLAIFALAFPESLRHRRPVRIAVVAGIGVLFINYVSWRIPVTVLPAATLDAQGILVWSLFAIELLAWIDSAILFAALARRRERERERCFAARAAINEHRGAGWRGA